MIIKQDYDLSGLNTFGVPAKAKFFTEIESESDLKELFDTSQFKDSEKLFLGGGSNVLFTKDFNGIVVLNKLKGIEVLKENPETILIRAMSGEIWHDLVSFAVSGGYWGIENLSLIPGTVGAAPMQNIGAYGAELKDTLEKVETVEIETGKPKTFANKECEFGYRDSIFKKNLKNKYFISAITLRLSKIPQPNISYQILAEHLKKNTIDPDHPKKISEAVSEIRRSKLPDPKLIGNAGSFFKNVFTTEEKAQELSLTYPNMPTFEEDGMVKIPAGWLIEQCGLKGYRSGNVGVHDKQALVLVNYGGATGAEIKALAELVIDAVFKKFGLKLVPEVNFI